MFNSIQENSDAIIKNIMLFPFLGATDQDQTDGYLVVPDGSGAILAYADQTRALKAPYQAKMYGSDYATNDNKDMAQRLSLPIYGMVNAVDKSAMYAYIEQGSAYACLQVYPASVPTEYNWATFQFDYRQNFF